MSPVLRLRTFPSDISYIQSENQPFCRVCIFNPASSAQQNITKPCALLSSPSSLNGIWSSKGKNVSEFSSLSYSPRKTHVLKLAREFGHVRFAWVFFLLFIRPIEETTLSCSGDMKEKNTLRSTLPYKNRIYTLIKRFATSILTFVASRKFQIEFSCKNSYINIHFILSIPHILLSCPFLIRSSL